MEFKITGTAEDLHQIHQLIYKHDQEIEVDEEYGPNEGFQKEPLVVALLTVASSTVTGIITAYLTAKAAKKNADIEKYKVDKEAETEQLKIWLKESRKWKEISLKELELLQNKNT
jgi:hypothetical protein